MASKRTITGYLVLKPAGAFSRFKGRQRMWFVLDESRLLYYKNEADAQSQEPLGVIDIRGSAISLEEENQFVIHSNGKEHALVAEDPESMMLWILAMQQASSSVQNKVVQRTHSLQMSSNIKHETLKRMHSLWATTSQDRHLMTNGKPILSKRPSPVQELPPDSRPLSPTARAVTESTDTNNNNHSQGRTSIIKEPSTDRSSDTESCDDSDISDVPDNGSDRIRLLRKMNSEGTSLQDRTPSKDRASSLSGTSVSSDSAVGTSDCSISVRLQELESELMCTKCDLAKALNRESAYKSIIEDKILLVNELEERLRTAEDPDHTGIWKSPIHKGNSGSLGEKCRILQNHNRFLNEEVLKLSKMLQQEKRNTDRKHHQMCHLEAEVDQLKRDYVFLMQSSLRINNCDGPETMEVYHYGGNRHKARVLSLLEEARKINPTLPIYENCIYQISAIVCCCVTLETAISFDASMPLPSLKFPFN